MMENNVKFVIYFLIWIAILHVSNQIYVPDDGTNQKPITYTSGIKTSSYRKPFQIHHNYSRVYHQNSDTYTRHIPDDENDETSSQRPYPIYNGHTYGARPSQSDDDDNLRQTYILNGTRIRKNENPTRQIVKYNKEKRSSKIEVYRTCPEDTTGQFVYEFSCNQFLNCWKGRGYVQNCAPGTLFNPKTLECDFPEKVYCVSGPRRTILQHERKSENIKQVGCPKQFSGLIPNYTDCSKFINCVSGIENLMDCPPGTLFDINKNICDFAHKTNCFNRQNQNIVPQNIDGKLDFAQPKRTTHEQLRFRFDVVKCPDGAAGLHKHPTDCSKFLNCADGQTYIQDCAPGTLFNPVIKICDFPYNVRCENNSNIDYDADGSYYSQNKSLRDYSTNRNEWNGDNRYFGQNQFVQGSTGQYVPYSTTNSNNYSQSHQSSSFGRGQTLYNDNLSGHSSNNYDQQEQTQHNRRSDNQELGYYGSSTRRYGNVGYDGSRYYDSSTTRYRDIDDSRSVSYGGGTSNLYQNQYQKGSREQKVGIYGSDPVLSRPNQNVNTWDGQGTRVYPHQYNPQNQYTKNQQELGIYSSRPDVSIPNQNVNGNQGQGSNIYSTQQYHNNVDREYQPYNIKGSSGGRVYQEQNSENPYNKGTYDTSWGSNTGSGTYHQNYWGNENTDSTYNQRQPESGTYGQIGSGQRPINSYKSNGHDLLTQREEIYPYGNNQLEISSSKKRPFSTQYPGETLSQNQRNDRQHGQTGKTDYDRNIYQNGHTTFQNQNNLDELEVTTTTNYDQVVNINQIKKTTRVPFRNSYEPFFGPTTLKTIINPISQSNDYISFAASPKYIRATTPSVWRPINNAPVSQTNDYEDTFVPDHSNNFVRTTPKNLEKNWPPPFPSTDVNADYVFEYDDNDEVTLEAENSFKTIQKTNSCGKSDFRCSNDKCISKSFICNSFKDCPNGEDELNCLEYVSKFSLQKDRKLAVLEKERWNNISIATCALLCVQTQKFTCRSFNYRKIDKTCFLTNTNEGLTGAIISYYPFDYYELNSEKVNCSEMYVCQNKKCIEKKKMCDGADDCGDRMDEKGCKPQDYGYNIKLAGSATKKNEGYVQVTAFGKTGFICDDQFGLRDANVVCKELGFHLGATEVKGNSFFGKNFTKPFYMMDDVGCIGNETSLMDCDFSGWGVHNCREQEIVGVICKTPLEKCASDYWQCDTGQECLPLAFVCDGLLDCTDGSDEGSQHCDAPTQIRLVNGSSRQEGRVEIRHNGIWGTICDDDFNEDAAKVVCKQLGYRGSVVVKKDAHFGSGSGPIWLDQVFCSGNETSVEDCSHWNWGEHNCEHSEDVGVICKNKNEQYEERHQTIVSPVIPQTYPDRCGYRNDNIFTQDDDVHFRVVRGSVAKRGDYPWQAAVRVKGKSTTTHWCGAVIISEKFVLTAAHCLLGYPKGAYVVVAGDYNVDEPEGTEQESYIEDYYPHENFRQGHKMNNDIALVKLKGRGFVLGGDVQAICLPEANTSYETNHQLNCTISGFGSIESGKSAFSHNLRAGWVTLQKREICTMPHVYGDAMTDGMICAGSLDEGVDSCDGDSGGPLACLDNGVFTLYGITSWGQHCGYANKPGVYVKVAHYRRWIDDNFKKYSAN